MHSGFKVKSDYTVIGIDGGGSKTRGRLVFGDQHVQRVIGSTRVGVVGFTEACERVVQLISDLTQDAGQSQRAPFKHSLSRLVLS